MHFIQVAVVLSECGIFFHRRKGIPRISVVLPRLKYCQIIQNSLDVLSLKFFLIFVIFNDQAILLFICLSCMKLLLCSYSVACFFLHLNTSCYFSRLIYI